MGVGLGDRESLAAAIADRIDAGLADATAAWRASGPIRHVVVDRLLPGEVVAHIHGAFPPHDAMIRKRSLREDKYIAVQMDRYEPILEEALYAFQDPRVVDRVATITGLQELHPDPNLYAGGISSMGTGQFLNPHLDNSHDKDRGEWRVLNLLYYVTPDWSADDGGSLELWPGGTRGAPVVIPSACNRLVIMETHGRSLHSVSPISGDRPRRCISNYYFSPHPADRADRFHVTSFRGRPEQRLRDLALRADARARMGLRALFRRGVRENPHVYKPRP